MGPEDNHGGMGKTHQEQRFSSNLASATECACDKSWPQGLKFLLKILRLGSAASQCLAQHLGLG